MVSNIRGRSFLTLLDFTPEEINYLLDLSDEFKRMKNNGIAHKWLTGKQVVLLFEKTSTRTRCAFEVGARDLGMGVTFLDPGSSQMGKRSPWLIPPRFWAGCMTASSTGASSSPWLRILPGTPAFPCGTV